MCMLVGLENVNFIIGQKFTDNITIVGPKMLLTDVHLGRILGCCGKNTKGDGTWKRTD